MRRVFKVAEKDGDEINEKALRLAAKALRRERDGGALLRVGRDYEPMEVERINVGTECRGLMGRTLFLEVVDGRKRVHKVAAEMVRGVYVYGGTRTVETVE